MKVRFYISNGMVGGRREEIMDLSDEGLEFMEEEEREEYLDQLATDFMNNIIDYGYEVLE